jgi:aspartate/methionine/tyrosine aminotransferase
MSKAYSLAGIRVGWIASRASKLISKIYETRHYTTISVSQLDSQVASYALSSNTIHSLLARNVRLAKTNLEIMEKFIDRHDDWISWVKPVAGTTAFIKFSRNGKEVDADMLCERLVKDAGVLWAPGSVFGKEFGAYARVGFACETEVLREGLDKARVWLRKAYDDVPLLASA